jgi:hypothetical protein
MKGKILIEVRTKQYFKDGKYHGGKVIKTIKRKPFNLGFMGNFVPYWVRYNKQEFYLNGGSDSAYIQGEPIENYIEVE